MNAYSTTKRPAKMQMAFPRNAKQLVQEIFAAARSVNPNIDGLTHVTPSLAVMQEFGNKTYFVVEITAEQAAQLGYVA